MLSQTLRWALNRGLRVRTAGLPIVLILTSCGVSGSIGQARAGTVPVEPVTVASVRIGTISGDLSFTGDVIPSRQVNLVPRVAGVAVKVLADVGTQVKAGQELAELDHVAQDAALAQAQAQLLVARAALSKVQAQGRPEEIAKAQAAVAQQQAKLDLLQKQGRPEVVAQAQAKLAQDNQQLAADQAALTSAQSKLHLLQSPLQLDTYKQSSAEAKNNLYSAQAARDASCAGISNGPPPPTGKGTTCSAAQAAVNAAQTAVDRANDIYALNLDPATIADAQSQVKQAQAALDKDKAGMQADEQALALAKSPNATEDISGQKAIVDQAVQSLKEAAQPYVSSDVEGAQAQVQAAQANLDAAAANQELTKVTAPFDGVVSSRMLTEGGYAMPTQPIFTIISSDVQIDLPVSPEQLGRIQPGQTANITTQARPGRTITGKVSAIAPIGDSKSGTVLVRVTPASQVGDLTPGLPAGVTVKTSARSDTLLVPQSAIATDGDSKAQGVFVVDDSSGTAQAMFKPATFGMSDGSDVEVLHGLSEGDPVITSEQAPLTSKQPVRVTNSSNAS